MKNDFMSVGPPQLFGDRIDRPLGLDPGLRGDFENLLKKGLEKKEQKVESALGGTNQKVPKARDGSKETENKTKASEPEGTQAERREKERRRTKISNTGVEMSASNTMVSVESSFEVGSLESDFAITKPEQNLQNESATEDAALTVAPVQIDVQANVELDMALLHQQNLNLVKTDFEKSIQAQLARDQKELTIGQPVEELTSESRMDSFENLSQVNQELVPVNQNVVSTAEVKQTNDFAALQSAQNSQSEFSGKSEQEFDGQDQSGSDHSIVSLDQQVDARQLHTHRDSDFRSQLGTATAAQSLGKESTGLSTADRSEIVKQAQVLVNDGGGTAKIQLQSEELGAIDLYVRLTHGKVQIEVGSNDPAVKAAIEDSLSDLKSSLAQHNFDLDHVKIKSVSGASENFSMQSNHSNHGNSSTGTQHQNEGNKSGFASHGGDGSGQQSHRDTQMREMGMMYRQNQTQTAERSDVIQPIAIGRGISRYQKNDLVATAGRSAWVA